MLASDAERKAVFVFSFFDELRRIAPPAEGARRWCHDAGTPCRSGIGNFV